ncbi:hypothetical protein Hypma_011681 [Hypsizygus marmoreus]|uniref:Uncharacterized protein n=1 Tax=Hypsizygus marmoreus TaxID=39966 RepID=A0A369JLI3_HYPMA|nr:hypothetical protein Hypma_011681 [Hypsizygus marmoreus]
MTLRSRSGRLPRKFAVQRTPTRPKSPKSRSSTRLARKYKKAKGRPFENYEKQILDDTLTTRIAKAEKPSKHNAENEHLAAEETTVPDPIPETGFRPTQAQAPPPASSVSATAVPSVHSVPLSKTGLPSPVFSALPPLLSLGPTTAATPTSSTQASSHSGLVSSNSEAKAPHAHQASQTHKLSTPIIVLLAVGSGLLLVGFFVFIKIYSRPTRRPRPKPSLPILEDPFADDKMYKSESPVFGGKERTSSSGLNSGLWTWTQYVRPSSTISRPDGAAKSDNSPKGGSFGYGAVARSPRLQSKGPIGRSGKGQYNLSGHAHTQSAPHIDSPVNSMYQPSLQQVKGALSRTASRISAASMSLYPASPQPSHRNIGLAIGGYSPQTTFTADGLSVLQRSASKASRTGPDTESGGLLSKTKRYSQGLAYNDVDVPSPTFLPYAASQPANIPSHAGRTKIKSSYYTPGTYPRTSGSSNPEAVDQPQQKQPSLRKSESRRDRDTQALTYALGLSSPASTYAMPSPQPTLYPDDSLSVVDGKAPKRQLSKRKVSDKDVVPSLPVIATATDASAALGSLMLMDFSPSGSKRMSMNGASKPLGSVTNLASSKSNKLLAPPASKAFVSRSDDKPPYIPLPAPLPSLSQMGLEHANPQAYADYRSPTYSIYGLYEAERKSVFGQST